jgi:hypothetical protein
MASLLEWVFTLPPPKPVSADQAPSVAGVASELPAEIRAMNSEEVAFAGRLGAMLEREPIMRAAMSTVVLEQRRMRRG